MSTDFHDSLMNELRAHKYPESQIFLRNYWLIHMTAFLNYWLVHMTASVNNQQCSNPDPNNTTNPSHSIHTDHTTPHYTDTGTQIRVIREGREWNLSHVHTAHILTNDHPSILAPGFIDIFHFFRWDTKGRQKTYEKDIQSHTTALPQSVSYSIRTPKQPRSIHQQLISKSLHLRPLVFVQGCPSQHMALVALP